MVDTHCHLNLEPLRSTAQSVLERAQNAGIEEILVVGTDLETSELAVSHAFTSGQTASVGIHPHEAVTLLEDTQNTQQQLDFVWNELEFLASSLCVRAIGECGLDYSQLDLATDSGKSESRQQQDLFALHLRLAAKLDLPVIIHCRDQKDRRAAYDDVLTMLKRSHTQGQPVRFVLHCVSGPLDYIDRCLALGAFISFAGNLTYPSAHSIRDILHRVPLDRLLTETDAPFLSPQSKRGKPNEPSYMRETVEFMAAELKMSFQALDQLTTQNAKTFFSL